ncbi:MAG: hypothetical protein E7164_01870 [Firmicutes bacterium]|nr:hypothetical protein [Bacillota bacterium]
MKSEEKNYKTVMIAVVSVIVMIITVTSFTYAFFTAKVSTLNNLSINATISDEYSPVLTAYPSGDLSVMVTSADMLDTGASSDNTSIGDSAKQNLYVTLSAGGGQANSSVTCTYDLVWKDTSAASYVPSPNAVSENLKEYTIKVIDNTGSVIYAENGVDTMLSSAVNNELTLATGLSIVSSGTMTTKTYTVIATIYNLNVVQNIYNKTYSSMIGVTNVTC